MYLIYIDESGDYGIENSPSKFLALSGIVIHESSWLTYLDKLIDFRKSLRHDAHIGLKLREEIHSARLITRPGELSRISKHKRLFIIKKFAEEIASYKKMSIINVLIDKTGKDADYDVMENAWKTLLQRAITTLKKRNYPDSINEFDGLQIFHDMTNNEKVKKLSRKLRRYNPVPNKRILGFSGGYRDMKMDLLIEDPNPRVSRHSYFIQMADLSAFLLYQYHCPNKYFKEKGGVNYLRILEPIMCKTASSTNELGIVCL